MSLAWTGPGSGAAARGAVSDGSVTAPMTPRDTVRWSSLCTLSRMACGMRCGARTTGEDKQLSLLDGAASS